MIPVNKIGNFEIRDEGNYVSLYEGNQMWNANHPSLNKTQQRFLDLCWGKVLVGGLGTGWAVEYLAKKENVTEIIVVEIAQEIIDLVWSYIDTRDKGKIVCMDLFEFLKYPPKIDTAYLDIYNNVGGKKAIEGNAKLRTLLILLTDEIYFWSYA